MHRPVAAPAAGRLHIESELLRLIRLRTVTAAHQGRAAGPGGVDPKILADEHGQQIMGLAKDLAGPAGMLVVPAMTVWHYGFLFSPALTIGGGTGEVQRNIVAERVLGLPHGAEWLVAWGPQCPSIGSRPGPNMAEYHELRDAWLRAGRSMWIRSGSGITSSRCGDPAGTHLECWSLPRGPWPSVASRVQIGALVTRKVDRKAVLLADQTRRSITLARPGCPRAERRRDLRDDFGEPPVRCWPFRSGRLHVGDHAAFSALGVTSCCC